MPHFDSTFSKGYVIPQHILLGVPISVGVLQTGEPNS